MSSEAKTADGNITIPAGCVLVLALVKGSVAAPKINNVGMAPIVSVEVNGAQPAVSVFQVTTPKVTGVAVPFELSGTLTYLVYLSGVDQFRPGAFASQSLTGSFTKNLVTTTTDMVFGLIAGAIGPTSLKGDTVAMTYLYNTATEKVGWITPLDALLTCLAEDTGLSAGYYIDNGVIHHDAELITEGYYSFDPVENHVTYVFAGYNSINNTTQINRFDNGVYTGVSSVPGYIPDPSSMNYTYYTYPAVWHDPVYSDAWDEEIPDTYVPAGPAPLSCAFVSLRVMPGSGFVGYVIEC